jgi:alginate O-acetyltransferase complex protein AlgI
MTRTGRNKVKAAVMAVSPVLVLAILMLCTAVISYSGSSDMLLMKL